MEKKKKCMNKVVDININERKLGQREKKRRKKDRKKERKKERKNYEEHWLKEKKRKNELWKTLTVLDK